jgi:cell division protein FtsW (lipid II flippase)
MILLPLATLLFLLIFASLQWIIYSRITKIEGETQYHNERIYKDFEFFVKVFISLVAGFGFIRFSCFQANPELSRQAMKSIGGIAILTMVIISIFIICHQGSKIRRWKTVEWK